MMVFVVVGETFQEWASVLGVFSTEELAQEFIDKGRKINDRYDDYVIHDILLDGECRLHFFEK